MKLEEIYDNVSDTIYAGTFQYCQSTLGTKYLGGYSKKLDYRIGVLDVLTEGTQLLYNDLEMWDVVVEDLEEVKADNGGGIVRLIVKYPSHICAIYTSYGFGEDDKVYFTLHAHLLEITANYSY